jgi:hypothetical protein
LTAEEGEAAGGQPGHIDDPWDQGSLAAEEGLADKSVIVSASYKTDIPAFYGDWFLRRLQAGICRVRNPYNGLPFAVPTKGRAVAGYVFWTRNMAPFFSALAKVREAGLPFMVQYTCTGYPEALEAATPGAEAAVAQVKRLADEYGPRCAVWRYDPVVFTSFSSARWHIENFSKLAAQLKGLVDEVVVSFYQPYRKSARNLAQAGEAHSFMVKEPSEEQKRGFILRLAAIAADQGMRLSLCAQRELLSVAQGPAEASGGGGVVHDAACVDVRRLSDLAGSAITVKGQGHRGKACACAPSRDIGAYDTCPQGCAYCYANISREGAQKNLRRHDNCSDFLLEPA